MTNGQFNAAFASVTQTYNLLTILEQTQAQIADAETGQRGWLLTGRPDYFSLYDTAMAAINNDIQKLQILVRGNPVEEANLAELQSLVTQRLDPNSGHRCLRQNQFRRDDGRVPDRRRAGTR